MGLKTRVDARSKTNNKLQIVRSKDGQVVAEIEAAELTSINLDISTLPNYHVAKPNGWSSKK